ncbi:MAG TPA: diacylglycerol kinase family protein [Verrucomicrobiae bacterium]
MLQTCIIFNPSARGNKAESFCSKLEALCQGSALRRTTGPGGARALAAQAVHEGFSTIVAAGGDGTANEVVNGIGDVPGGFSSARLAILPLGTINVFARELGLPRNLQGVAKAITAAKERVIDLGVAEFQRDGKPERRYFLQLAGAGIDSRAIELVSWGLKKKIGPLAYVWAGFKALLEKQPNITVDAGRRVSGELILVGNGKFYGGSFAAFPKASLEDGMLDVCVIEKVAVLRVVELLLGYFSGNLFRFCPAVHLSAPKMTFASDSRALLQVDGENAGDLPVTFSVLPKVLRVVAP